jgi:hypothetical protein
MSKITETGTEILKRRGRPPGNGKISIEAPHEPLMSQLSVPELAEQPNPTIIPVAQQPVIAQPLKIAMIGTAPSSRDLAPFGDPSWTIWACSPGNQGILPRVDAWFEVHSNLLWPECASYGKPYVEWLKQQKFPIYMQDQSLVPNATRLPIQELVNEFGKYFFTSSFAYMIAMGIRAGAKEIALFGIDMASKDEYILQRPGGHYFMQRAAERGIKVSIPYESDLGQAPELYGYGDSTPYGRKLHVRKQELIARIAQMSGERDKLNHNITY